MPRHKSNILATVQHGGGEGGGGIHKLRNQAAALAQYVALSGTNATTATGGQRTAHKQKDTRLQLNRQSKLAVYLRSSATANKQRVRVFTVQERMNIAEKQHEQRLYNWNQVRPKRRQKQKYKKYDAEEAVRDGPETDSDSNKIKHFAAPHTNPENSTHQTTGTEAAAAAATTLPVAPVLPSNTTLHRMRHNFEVLESGRPGRMLQKKPAPTAAAATTTFRFVPVPPSKPPSKLPSKPTTTHQIDPKLLANRIFQYKLNATTTVPANIPTSLPATFPTNTSTHNNSSMKSPTNASTIKVLDTSVTAVATRPNPPPRSLPGQEKTEDIMRNMRLYVHHKLSPHLFDPNAMQEILMQNENCNAKHSKNQQRMGVGKASGVALLVSKFHKKIRRRQLMSKYSTAKDLSDVEYMVLQQRTTAFFLIQTNTTDTFVSALMMRFIENKQGLSVFAQNGLQDLIEQRDAIAMYALHVYMNDSKMLQRFFKTRQRLLKRDQMERARVEMELYKVTVLERDSALAVARLLL